mmetsp:Transcript_93358/g.237628  ORF Transcript_93358/g.237628 Transcript_93358/m.237628 type:complete len:226 (+) Transcript_93358:776-1453(+)
MLPRSSIAGRERRSAVGRRRNGSSPKRFQARRLNRHHHRFLTVPVRRACSTPTLVERSAIGWHTSAVEAIDQQGLLAGCIVKAAAATACRRRCKHLSRSSVLEQPVLRRWRVLMSEPRTDYMRVDSGTFIRLLNRCTLNLPAMPSLLDPAPGCYTVRWVTFHRSLGLHPEPILPRRRGILQGTSVQVSELVFLQLALAACGVRWTARYRTVQPASTGRSCDIGRG